MLLTLVEQNKIATLTLPLKGQRPLFPGHRHSGRSQWKLAAAVGEKGASRLGWKSFRYGGAGGWRRLSFAGG